MRRLALRGLPLLAVLPAFFSCVPGDRCGSNSRCDDDDPGAITLTTAPPPASTSGEETFDGEDDWHDLPDEQPPGCDIDQGCSNQIDLLFVIDNSGTMAEEQLNLARNFPRLVERLEDLRDSNGDPIHPDVQVMVTTTDMGNPLCTMHQPLGYEPATGAPVVTGCNVRIADFTGLGTNPTAVPEACTSVCPQDLVPGDPFIAFSANGTNVPAVAPIDVDGDGVGDSAIAQALACIGPQGINGCGFESQLESMMQALNPGAAWNNGPRPFLRDGALLAVAIVTDEVECSVQDYGIMTDESFQETDPDTAQKEATSAVCWNAGVTCNGPDANGVYTDCQSIEDGGLQPLSRYVDYLVGELRERQNKEVVMLGVLGVPEVTEHDPNPPHAPIAGGELDLVYRTWRDGSVDAGGDILPTEPGGTDAADKTFELGIGPACTGVAADGTFTGQATPNTRVMEACHALDYVDENGALQTRCCIESICDDDFSAAIDCLTGVIGQSLVPVG